MTSTVPQRSATISPQEQAQLDELYAAFEAADMKPLWTQIGGLMPTSPLADAPPDAVAVVHVAAAGRAGRRAGAGRPGWGAAGDRAGQPRAARHRRTRRRRCGPRSSTSVRARRLPRTGTPRPRSASWSRARASGPTSTAIRSRCGAGDLLLTPGMHFHEHHNTTDHPMAWIDGLDIPLVRTIDAGFFEFGPDVLATKRDPGGVAQRAALGPPGPHPGRRSCAEGVAAAWPTAGSTPTPRSPRSSSWRTRDTPASSSPATRWSGSPTPPRRATACRPCGARCTASARAPAPR